MGSWGRSFSRRPTIARLVSCTQYFSMAKTPKTPPPAAIPVLGKPELPPESVTPTAPDEAPPDELDSILAELGGVAESYAVSIFRRQLSGSETGQMAYVTRVPLAGFTLEDLQRDYGGGRYVLKVYNVSTGRYQKSRTVVLEGAPSSVSPSSHTVPEDSETKALLRTIADRLSPVGAPPTPPVDMFGMFERFAGVMNAMRSDTQPTGSSAKELLDMYFKGRKDQQEEDSRSAPSGGVGDVVRDFGAPLLALARENMDMQRQVIASVPAAAPAPMTVQGPTTGEPNVAPPWVRMMGSQVQGLYQRAKAGKQARVYANAMVEDLPDLYVPHVQEALQDPDFVNQFVAAYPMFAGSLELRQWIEDFVDEARVLLLGGDDEQLDDDNAGVAANG